LLAAAEWTAEIRVRGSVRYLVADEIQVEADRVASTASAVQVAFAGGRGDLTVTRSPGEPTFGSSRRG
jgi:hypothetical protein